MASTSIATVMTKKGYIVQSTPPAEYVMVKWGSGRRNDNPITVARSATPYCPRCGVSEHSHGAIGCGVSVSLAQELADLL